MRNLWVEKDLEFRADATHGANVKGPMQEKKRHDFDRFTRPALDTTNLWTTYTTGTTGPATVAISEVQGGSVLITTGTVDDDSVAMSKPVIYSGNKKAACEWYITITDVSGTGVFLGFSDEKNEANGLLAIGYPADAETATATNGVGFVIDADHATSSIMCCGVKAGTKDTAVDSGTDWADGETKTLRVELGGDPEGNNDGAVFYLDGKVVGFLANAVTAATLLCPTVQAITRANDGANTVRVRSYDAWQDD